MLEGEERVFLRRGSIAKERGKGSRHKREAKHEANKDGEHRSKMHGGSVEARVELRTLPVVCQAGDKTCARPPSRAIRLLSLLKQAAASNQSSGISTTAYIQSAVSSKTAP